jgi:type I restriction enzyme M protein
MESEKAFMRVFGLLVRKYSAHQVFDDFLTLTVCTLSQGEMEEVYLETVKKYTKDEGHYFPNLYAQMIMGMDDMHDFLGHIYMEIRNNYKGQKLGQFFTPQPVCDMMARMTMDKEKYFAKVNDPACGSGRLLLGHAKVSKTFQRVTARYYGQDLDHMCVKMTLINCALNGLLGEIYHMNTISMEYYNGYRIDLKNGIPCVFKATEETVDSWNVLHNEYIEKLLERNKTKGQLTLF